MVYAVIQGVYVDETLNYFVIHVTLHIMLTHYCDRWLAYSAYQALLHKLQLVAYSVNQAFNIDILSTEHF